MKILGRGLMVLLLLAGLTGISLGAPHEIAKWRDNKAGAVSLTFDDGYISYFTIGVPALNARGFKGTFFIITNYTDDPTSDPLNIKASWDNWRTAAAQGHEIGSHSKSHPIAGLDSLTPTQLLDEVQGSKATIDAQIPAQACLAFAYPYGITNDSVTALVQSYYLGARGILFGLNDTPYYFNYVRADFPDNTESNGSTLERETDLAIQTGKWLVMGFHRIDGQGDYNPITEDRFKQILDYLKTKNQSIWAATFGSVLKYIKEREAATLALVSSSGTQIVLNLTDALDDSIYNEPLTLRSEVPTNWGLVEVRQGNSVTTVKTAVVGGTRIAYYDAVPDRGQIVLSKGTAKMELPIIIK
jgi:peptidoglycan/xylan/chitin deacetylase (PgdA/CDA1 family)